MPTYEELAAAEQAVRDVLARGAEAELMAIPGVIGVAAGLKERGGTVTPQHAIRVYVREKKPEDALAPAERIPREIGGVPTDVNVVPDFGFNVDNTQYRPILGGIQISNRIIDSNAAMTGTQMSRGTLGCIATRTADKSPVLLSNWHVLMANFARKGDRVYQPAPTSIPPVSLGDLPLRPKPDDDTNAIGRIVDSVISDKVDGAIARIDVSSCCRCCGIDYKNEINGLSAGGQPASNFIRGQRAAVAGMTVYKVGMMTGRSVGTVVTPTMPSFGITSGGTTYNFTGQIEISSNDPVKPFSQHGDSGSVIIDNDGFIVGLLFGSNSASPPASRSVANHIADVCSQLGITINITPSGSSSGARVAVPASVFVEPGTGTEAYREVRARLLADPAGAWLMETADAHRIEVVNLVLNHRPVTVAWHRAQGPAFLAQALNTLRDGGDALPAPVAGVTLAAALARMGDALAAHGSAGLREVIEANRDAVLEIARGSTTLGEVLEKLNALLLVRA